MAPSAMTHCFSVALLLWLCAESATCRIQTHGSGLLQTEQHRSTQVAMGALVKDVELNSSAFALGWQSGLRAEVAADGQSAVVRLPVRGGSLHEYQMRLTSAYSKDAVVAFHTIDGSTKEHPRPRRTFSSQVYGRRARATIWDDGAVAGLFEYGPHLLRVEPLHERSQMPSMSALQESRSVLHHVSAVGGDRSQHAGPELVVDDIGAPDKHTDAILAPAGSDALPSLEGS